MAKFQTDYSFNIEHLNFYPVTKYAVGSSFSDNANLTFNGDSYPDVLTVEWHKGTDYRSVFGGVDLTVNGSDALTGGTVTGYFQEIANGSAWTPSWGLQDISVSAASFYQAFQTSSTADDKAAFEAIFSGADTIRGSNFDDVLSGFAGDDHIHGGAGHNVVSGGAGNDTLYSGNDNDVMDGGDGVDTASFADAASAVDVFLELQPHSQNTLGAGTDRLSNFENLEGSSFDDGWQWRQHPVRSGRRTTC